MTLQWGERFSVYWDHEKDCLAIQDASLAPGIRGIEIARKTLIELGLTDACTFIGERFAAANPVLRELFRGQFPGDQEP